MLGISVDKNTCCKYPQYVLSRAAVFVANALKSMLYPAFEEQERSVFFCATRLTPARSCRRQQRAVAVVRVIGKQLGETKYVTLSYFEEVQL